MKLTPLEKGVLDKVLNPDPDEPHVAAVKTAMKYNVKIKGTKLDYKREKRK